jgi:uroporphyrinogen decarboxylase
MRQAGRYLPGYREVRSKHGFWEVCHTPELSTKVALEPLDKFPLDAAIVFSDILVVPEALGLGVTFEKGEGPLLARPMRTREDLRAWNTTGITERLSFLPRAVRHLSDTLAGRVGLLGFAGAPFTLFSYCVEGSGSDDFRHARTMLSSEPSLARDAMGLLSDAVAELCLAQLRAGADAVQLFDTWGGLLTRDEYREFALPAINRVARLVRAEGKPVILFIKGGMHLLPLLAEAEIDGVSLDWRTSFKEARAVLPNHILQGNFDPIALFAPESVVRERAAGMMAELQAQDGARGCIVNLGHGILPGTPESSVRALCEVVTQSATR